MARSITLPRSGNGVAIRNPRLLLTGLSGIVVAAALVVSAPRSPTTPATGSSSGNAYLENVATERREANAAQGSSSGNAYLENVATERREANAAAERRGR